MATEKPSLLPFVLQAGQSSISPPLPLVPSVLTSHPLTESDLQRLRVAAKRHWEQYKSRIALPDDEEVNDLVITHARHIEERLLTEKYTNFTAEAFVGTYYDSGTNPDDPKIQLRVLTWGDGERAPNHEEELRCLGATSLHRGEDPILLLFAKKRLISPSEISDTPPLPPLLRQATMPPLELISVWSVTIDGRFAAAKIGIARSEEGRLLPTAPEFTFVEEECQPPHEVSLGESFFEGFFMGVAFEAMLT